MPDLKALFSLAPAEALAYMQARGLLLPTFSWQDLLRDEHAIQFTVAELARLDLLDAIYRERAKNAGQGQSLRDFTKTLRPLLEKAGWWGDVEVIDPKTGEVAMTRFDPARLKLIYDTNLRVAHGAGQWERIIRDKATRLSKYSTLKDKIITSFWMLGLLQIIIIIQYVVQTFNAQKIEELKFGKKAIFRQASTM